MTLLTLLAPGNITGSFSDSRGNVAQIDPTGRVTIDSSVYLVQNFYDAGFAAIPDIASAVRPTLTYPGQPYFDTTLNAGTGRPIWRNAANTGWVDSTGATV